MIRPLRDRIVVEPLERPLSAILEVVQTEEKDHLGEVVAVGPQVKFDDKYLPRTPTDCKVGDRIQFTDIFKFPQIEYQGKRLLILQEADVCGVEDA